MYDTLFDRLTRSRHGDVSQDMLIISQYGDFTAWFNNLTAVRVEGFKVVAVTDLKEYTIGTYESGEDAKFVMANMLLKLGEEKVYKLPREGKPELH